MTLMGLRNHTSLVHGTQEGRWWISWILVNCPPCPKSLKLKDEGLGCNKATCKKRGSVGTSEALGTLSVYPSLRLLEVTLMESR